jgi:predicted LPLAT superfamily acyltransferase
MTAPAGPANPSASAPAPAPTEAPARAPAAAPAWLSAGERGNQAALRLMAFVAVTFGRTAARWLLHPITLYFVCFAPQARRHASRYLARALGRAAGLRDHYRHFHSFASVVLDRVYLVRGQLHRFDLQHQGVATLHATLDQGRGAFLLGAHLGSFEALHAIGAARPGMRVAHVMYPDNARMIQRTLQSIAPGFQMSVIAIGRSGSTLEIRDWLDGGGLVGLMGDRWLPKGAAAAPSARPDFVEMPFLGQPARFIDGPLRLAQVLRRRVLFMVGIYRGGNHYELLFEELADFSQPPASAEQREAQLRAALVAYVAKLEALCLAHPYNWFNFYDFWNEDA